MEYRGEQSTFNEGAGQMERINILQMQINNAWVNPLGKDDADKGSKMYGYDIIFSNNSSILQEVSSKLTDKELEEILKTKELIEKAFIKLPIRTKKWDDSLSGRKNTYENINYIHWDFIKKALFDYGLKIRKLLEEHNMTAPKQKDPSKAIFGN